MPRRHPVFGIAGGRREVETQTAGSRGTLSSCPVAGGAGRIARTAVGACRGGFGSALSDAAALGPVRARLKMPPDGSNVRFLSALLTLRIPAAREDFPARYL